MGKICLRPLRQPCCSSASYPRPAQRTRHTRRHSHRSSSYPTSCVKTGARRNRRFYGQTFVEPVPQGFAGQLEVFPTIWNPPSRSRSIAVRCPSEYLQLPPYDCLIDVCSDIPILVVKEKFAIAFQESSGPGPIQVIYISVGIPKYI